MSNAFHLTESDLSLVVNLLGDVITSPGGFSEKRQRVMDGLCGLIGGDAWAWTVLHFEEGQAPRQILSIHGGFDEGRLARWATAIEHPKMKPVTDNLVAEAMANSKGFTRRDTEFVPDEWWDSDDISFHLWSDAGIRSFMLSAWPVSNGGFSGIGIYRNSDRPHFNRRECRMAHLVLSEIPWLHGEGMEEKEGRQLVRLYPRHRTVLNLLCEGWDRKKISEHLGVGVNTVHGYTKAILKHFDVHSQAALIARFKSHRGG